MPRMRPEKLWINIVDRLIGRRYIVNNIASKFVGNTLKPFVAQIDVNRAVSNLMEDSR